MKADPGSETAETNTAAAGAPAQASRMRTSARLGDVRSRWLLPSLIVLSALTIAGVLYLTSYRNFYYDEWDFIYQYRPGQSTSVLFPHGEHWSSIPILIWKALFVLFGLRSHIPYEATVVVPHIACVVLMFALVRRRSGDLPAFAAALILLVLGTGGNDIVLAFQGAQTLSIAFGLLALLMVPGAPSAWTWWRIAVVAAVLLSSLMSSGLGLGFVVAITVQLLLGRVPRASLLAVAAPVSIYLVWFVAYGAAGSPCNGCPTAMGDIRSIGPAYIVDVVRFMALGISASVGGLFGLIVLAQPRVVVQASLVAFGGLLAWHWYVQRGAETWEVGLFAGLFAQFALIALARVDLGLTGAADSHYVYVGAVYLLPLAANAAMHFSWRSYWRPILVGGLAYAVLGNAILLAEQALVYENLMRTENAELRVVEVFRGAPDMALDRPLDAQIMPQLTAARYFPAIDQLGSPVPASVPTAIDKLPAQAVDLELVALFGDALKVTTGDQSAAGTMCQSIAAPSGSTLDIQVQEGRTIMLTAAQSSDASLWLGVMLPPSGRALRGVQLVAGTPELVRVPDTGRPLIWLLRVMIGPAGNLQVCGVDSAAIHPVL